MGLEDLTQVLRLAVEDDAFAAQLGTDESVLRGYDLTPEERRLLLDHDELALLEMGLDERLLEGLRAIPRHR